MARTKTLTGDTTCKKEAMITHQRVAKKKEKVVSSKENLKILDLDNFHVCDPGAKNNTDVYIDDVFEDDSYDDF